MQIRVNYKIAKNKKYLLACSFGPDSMALFDLLVKLKCCFIVVFVNYHQRVESDDEQKKILNYCNYLNIKCEILDTKKIKKIGNFQSWAREVRYNFFKKQYQKYNADGLFVAHHQDDLIETYIMQKNKCRVDEYGIKNISFIKEMKVIRPLLKYTKNELLNYCILNKIPFSIDKTNLETYYLRNKIRQKIINNLNAYDRQKILLEIEQKNKHLHLLREKIKKKINTNSNRLNVEKLISLSSEEFIEVIIQFLLFNLKNTHISLSKKRIHEIYKICLSKHQNIQILTIQNFSLYKEYNEIVFRRSLKEFQNYFYMVKRPSKLITKEFYIDFTNGAEDKNIFIKDYPVIIRPAVYNDKIKIGNFGAKIRRLFINWKLPVCFRKIWPVFCNLKNEILYVPKYNYCDNHKSKLIIKFSE